MMFELIPNASVITFSKGVFRQCKVFQKRGLIYVQYGSGYIRLFKSGFTITGLCVEELCLGFEPEYTPLGYAKMPKELN